MKNLLLVLLFSCSIDLVAHPFHVGVAEVEYNASKGRVEVSVKLFTDDLERALREAYKYPVLDIAGQKEHPATDSLIQDYLNQHFSFFLGEQRIPLKYLGKEGNLDANWIYIYFPVEDVPRLASIRFTAFFELFEDQRNLVHVNTDDVVTSICEEFSPVTKVSFD